MKAAALALLFLIVLNIIVPPAVVVCPPHGESCFCGLDVCGRKVPAVSANGSMPFIHECRSCSPHSPAFDVAYPDPQPLVDLLIVRVNEHPPQA